MTESLAPIQQLASALKNVPSVPGFKTRLGIVKSYDAASGVYMVTMVGTDAPVAAYSIASVSVSVGKAAWLLEGNNALLLIASVESRGETQRKVTSLSGIVRATSSLALTTSYVDIPSATITLACKAGDTVELSGVVDHVCSTYSAGVINVTALHLDGVIQNGQIISCFTAVGGRQTVAQNWAFTIATDGSYTFKLMALKTAALGVYNAGGSHTTLKYSVFATV